MTMKCLSLRGSTSSQQRLVNGRIRSNGVSLISGTLKISTKVRVHVFVCVCELVGLHVHGVMSPPFGFGAGWQTTQILDFLFLQKISIACALLGWSLICGVDTQNLLFRALPTFGCPVLNPGNRLCGEFSPFNFSQAELCLWMVCSGLEGHGLLRLVI